MACAIVERTSGLEPSSETTAPRYLKLVTLPNCLLHCPTACYTAQLLVTLRHSPANKITGFKITVKILKFGTPQTIAIIVLKIEKFDVTLQ